VTSGVDLDRAWRVVLRASAGLAVVAGALLFIGAEETDDWFSWTIQPPLTAAFLGGVYWAAAVLFWQTSRLSGWPALRTAAVAEAVAATGLLIATLIHLDKFHHDLFGYFWIIVYAIAAPAITLLTVALWRRGPRRDPAERPLSGGLRLAAAVQAGFLAAYGVLLFAAPTTFDALWPWELTPLTARAVASFLLGIAAALALAGAGVQRGAAAAFACLGGLELLAALLHRSDFTSTAAGIAFAAFFAAAALAGAAGARRLPRQSRTSASARSGS
jgi:hypothetical protein